MTNIVEAKGLNKVYAMGKSGTQAVLKNVDLHIKKGEFVSVMGPSGSGKSTLLYTISGMDAMSSGSVRFKDKELGRLSGEQLSQLRLHHMGFIFQKSHLLKNLNLMDNIILPAYQAQTQSRTTINKRARELMERTGIAQLSDHDITQASGGQLQRVSICRALINNPDIVFGDEPTGALNSKATEEVMNILAGINQSGTTIMLVTHDAKVAAKTERVLFMLDGSLIAEKQLGKYVEDRDNNKKRESQLVEWLSQMGF
jgi:putative ABC transport system ATP-binding protein